MDKYWQCNDCDSTYMEYPEEGICSFCGGNDLWGMDLEDYNYKEALKTEVPT